LPLIINSCNIAGTEYHRVGWIEEGAYPRWRGYCAIPFLAG
jgi:hypothetical protein